MSIISWVKSLFDSKYKERLQLIENNPAEAALVFVNGVMEDDNLRAGFESLNSFKLLALKEEFMQEGVSEKAVESMLREVHRLHMQMYQEKY